MLKLKLETTEVQNASVPIRWCLDEKISKQLTTENPEVYILLVVTNPIIGQDGHSDYYLSEKRESRWIVPLSQMVQYVSFKHPGENRILAAVIRGPKGELEKKYLYRGEYKVSTSYGRYNTDVIDYTSNSFYKPALEKAAYKQEFAELDIVVPKEFFAKEPPEWEKKWVNLMYKEPANDQCEYRKRRIIAYTIQPPIELCYIVWMLAVILPMRWLAAFFLLVAGWWNINFKPLTRPFGTQTQDIWRWRLYDDEKNIYFRVIVKLQNKLAELLFRESIESIKQGRHEREQRKLNIAQEKTREKIVQNYGILGCEFFSISPYSLLPLRQRVYLKFYDLKARVCRPFAG